MSADQLDTHLQAVVSYEIRLWNRLDRSLREADALPLARIDTLRAIAEHPGAARVRDIADAQQITVGAASRLLDRMLADGLVVRAQNPDDGRSSVVTLTATGAAALNRSLNLLRLALEEAYTGVDPATVAASTATLRALEERISQPSEEPLSRA